MNKEQQSYCVQTLKRLASDLGRIPLISEFNKELPRINVDELFGSYDNLIRAAGLLKEDMTFKPRPPKILLLDIETKPLKVWCWGIFDQNIGLDMIIEDWSILSWAAKWINNDKVMYQDLSQNTDYNDDKFIVKEMWKLLNEADVIITQNGTRFDEKKLNTKFEEYDLGAPSHYRHIDTLKIKKKKFALTSNKLEYSTNKFNETYKKLKHKNYPGMSLWTECLKGNQEAWAEMKEYNIHDVLAMEELYLNHLRKWDATINYGAYTGVKNCCPQCGHTDLVEKDFLYTKSGAFQQFQCNKCKSWCSSKHNELSASNKKGLLK